MRGLICALGCLFLLMVFLPCAAGAQCPGGRCGFVQVPTCDPQPTPADPAAAPAPAPVTVDPGVERSVLVRRVGPFWSRGPVQRMVSWPWRIRCRRCG
jgi:hypothetical protein